MLLLLFLLLRFIYFFILKAITFLESPEINLVFQFLSDSVWSRIWFGDYYFCLDHWSYKKASQNGSVEFQIEK